MLFDRKRYFGLSVALLLLTLGYVLMNGPDNPNANEFDEGLFNFRRLTFAPLVLVGTYLSLVFLILKKPKRTCSEEKIK